MLQFFSNRSIFILLAFFPSNKYIRIITEEDCDRVWDSVASGIQMMMDEEQDEQYSIDEEDGYV